MSIIRTSRIARQYRASIGPALFVVGFLYAATIAALIAAGAR